jgi:excisionase family DNA binding protein
MAYQDNTRQFLTLDEAAAMLQVSKRTLQRLIQRQKMPGLKIGGQWRVPESRFMKWVDEQMVSDSELQNAEHKKKVDQKNAFRSSG